jgi:diaminohydroxyphosphoribosylaminopyrimidine deaminase / 5-amino-6-(5-phosphoribosylamino)uracil reductase
MESSEKPAGNMPRFGVFVAQPARPDADLHWLQEAIKLSRYCPPSATAFSVGAVLIAADGTVLSTGFSRERDLADHAEEVALARLGLPWLPGNGASGQGLTAYGSAGHGAPGHGAPGHGAPGSGSGPDLAAATMYSSLEPCAARASRPVPCADLIIASGIGRVVIAWREPPIFVSGGGAVRLRKAGLAVKVIPELAAAARAVNAHLLS